MHVFMRSILVLGVCLGLSAAAHAGGFDEGRWRLQINAQTGIDSGSTERTGDVLALTTVEYEVPVTGHVAVDLKIHPFFAYTQDNLDAKDFFEGDFKNAVKDLWSFDEGGDTVWGGGIGVGTRIFQVKDEQRGIYLDLGLHVLAHAGRLNHDSSAIDFMSGLGLGYQFKCGINTELHFDHISNASLGDRNSGTNVIGLGLGYRF